jgi:hypothetical protein
MTRDAAGRARGIIAGLGLLSVTGCVEATMPPEVPPSIVDSTSGAAVDFELPGLDGGVVRSLDLRGRLSLIVVSATYDTASQAGVSMAAALVRRHKPRINGLLIVLEPEDNRPLAKAFVSAMDLPFPAAITDAATVGEAHALAGIRHVPSFVLLDRDGREVWRRVGLANVDVLEAVLREHERP